jgi:hypothetical protein
MVIDWMLVWTGVMAIVAVVTLIVSVFSWVMNRMRKADWEIIKGMKSDSDQKIANLELRVADVYTMTTAKLDKHEHQLALQRIDKEIGDLRTDAKQGQAEIRQDIKDLRQDLMSAIRDAIRDAK